ncbi:unnamed protein product [Moneuplotes crassus]|uniref:Transmembrane protein n=1 Tax=Euplotes crassus TaxID=5936 RepID=A0AAD1UR40_EUPCR|nr:unnamed protein product [Moneuplotes crassus]
MSNIIQAKEAKQEPLDFTGYREVILTWRIIGTICVVVAITFILWRLWKEVRDKYMDLLKILQFCTILIHFFITLFALIVGFVHDCTKLYSLKFLVSFDGNLISFILTNQMYWLSLIVYIKHFERMGGTLTYDQIRKRNRIFEGVFLSCILLFYILNITAMVLIIIGQFGYNCHFFKDAKSSQDYEAFCSFSRVLQNFFYYSKAPSFVIFCIVYCVLFLLLLDTMRRNLNYYYKERRKHLFLLFFSSVFFMGTTVVLGAIDSCFDLTLYSLNYFSEDFNSTKTVFVFIFILDVIQQMSYFFYIFDSINNINFKKYLWDIMKGYRIDEHYGNSSIFLRKSKFWKQAYEEEAHEEEYLSYTSTAPDAESFQSQLLQRETGSGEESAEIYQFRHNSEIQLLTESDDL